LHQPWLVVDLLCRPDSPRVKALPDYTVQLCDPARPMTVVNVGNARRRWEIMLMPGDDPARLTEPDIFWPMMKRWLGPEDAILERAAVYTFHSVVQEGWRKENLLLAGDACHQTPPFLGQGMCAGMRDAANLAWKLNAVLRDGALDSLLDTYESERRPHVETFIELAVKLGAILQETDPAKAAERDRRFAKGAEMFDFPQPQLGPGLRSDAPPPVGTIFPQPVLPDGRLMDESIGPRFAIVGEVDLLADRRPDAVMLPGVGAEWLAQRGLRAALLRPDRYIADVA
jgi:3-(3-hydroxy-phenyl)propionate hydroxylase